MLHHCGTEILVMRAGHWALTGCLVYLYTSYLYCGVSAGILVWKRVPTSTLAGLSTSTTYTRTDMGWGRDVIAPLLIAYSTATTSSALVLSLGGKRLLRVQPSSCPVASSLDRPDNDRCGHCSSFSSVSSSLPLTTTATRRRRSPLSHLFIGAHSCEVEQQTSSAASSNGTDTTVDTEATAAAVPSPQTTRYTIDVGVHPDVASVAVKHACQLPRFLEHYPISTHTKQAYDRAAEFVRDFHLSRGGHLDNDSAEEGGDRMEDEDRGGAEASGGAARERIRQTSSSAQQRRQFRVVLDSGCGTGRSSVLLAESYPHLPVLGVDRSAVRLSKGGRSGKHRNEATLEKRIIERDGATQRRRHHADDSHVDAWEPIDVTTGRNVDNNVCVTRSEDLRTAGSSVDGTPANLLLLRADLVDLWVLAMRDDAWAVEEHTILYPNPYPKRSQLRGRWHGHPVFPVLLGLGGRITLRSNWKAYLEEVCEAVLAINDAAMSTVGDCGGLVVGRAGSNGIGGSSGNRVAEAVATSAASYADSARGGPAVISPVTPLTNFEAKYVAVGETLYELRLEPGVSGR